MKHKVFPENPFLMTFSQIALIDGAVVILSIALAIWQSDWMWYALGGGALIAVTVFIVLNKRCLQDLSCPHCQQHIDFQAGKGFVCEKCKTIWELG